jgi:hypothetical protein
MTVQEQILEALGRAFCRAETRNKLVDPALAEAITNELLRIWPVVVTESPAAPTPSPGYVDCQIVEERGRLVFHLPIDNSSHPFEFAVNLPDFMGYVYAGEKKVWNTPIIFKAKDGMLSWGIDNFETFENEVLHASHVRFAVK